jgi:hypothetical protein
MERKVFPSEVKEADDHHLTVRHVISTEHVDRVGDIVRARGMKIRGKPVVLWSHGRGSMGNEPIAKPLWIKPGTFEGEPGVEAETQFFPDDLGRRLFRKVKEGFLHAWSIGFSVLRESPLAGGGRDIREWELLEYSLVPVPANPYATTPKGAGSLAFKILADGAASDRCHGHRSRRVTREDLAALIRETVDMEIRKRIRRDVLGKVD